MIDKSCRVQYGGSRRRREKGQLRERRSHTHARARASLARREPSGRPAVFGPQQRGTRRARLPHINTTAVCGTDGKTCGHSKDPAYVHGVNTSTGNTSNGRFPERSIDFSSRRPRPINHYRHHAIGTYTHTLYTQSALRSERISRVIEINPFGAVRRHVSSHTYVLLSCRKSTCSTAHVCIDSPTRQRVLFRFFWSSATLTRYLVSLLSLNTIYARVIIRSTSYVRMTKHSVVLMVSKTCYYSLFRGRLENMKTSMISFGFLLDVTKYTVNILYIITLVVR